jgi:hypothetical protein
VATDEQPEQAVGTFVEAATHWAAATTPDPRVAAALALGWRVGEALTWAGGGERPDGVADLGLGDDDRRAVLAGQIERVAKDLLRDATPPMPAGWTHPEVDALRTSLLTQLYIADDAIGKGFRLGHGLQQLCDPAAQERGARAEAASIPPLKRLLVDLGTKLPPHAGHSVRNSLTLWEEQIVEPGAAAALRRQGDTWRAILAGELAAKDILRLSDYVGTAEEVVERLRQLALRSLRRLWIGALVVVALIVLGVLILVLGKSSSAVTAGAGSLLAAFGLTWKGLGTMLGRAAAQGEQALWDAQVDWTIAYRATVTTAPPAAGTRLAHREHHVDTWRAWRARWPELDASEPGEPAQRGH